MHTYFVTGAEGFVGRHVVELLRQRGYHIVAGVRNRARKLAIEREFGPGAAFVCEVSDPINVARVIAGVRPDVIIHLAGPAGPAHADANPLAAFQTIVGGWTSILDATRRFAPDAHLVLASASDVYGRASSTETPVTEVAPPAPLSLFGSLKHAAELLAGSYYRDWHLNIIIARPFQCTGPDQHDRSYFGSVARRLLHWNASVDGSGLHLPDLSCRRDILHVADVAAAYVKLAESGQPNQIYNICSGETSSVRDVVAAMTTSLDLHLELCEIDPGAPERQVEILCGDNTKLTRLGWQPTRTVHDALRDLLGISQPVHAAARG